MIKNNENPETVYPNILNEQETQKLFDSKLNETRIKYMIHERDGLVEKLKHYKKILKKWKRLDKGFKITSVGIIATTSIAAAITGTVSAPLLIPIYIPAIPIVLGSLSAIESVVFSGIIMGLTARKKKKFNEKLNVYNHI